MPFDFYSNVHIWEAGAYVDGEAEVDGEVLTCMTEQFGALEHRIELAPLLSGDLSWIQLGVGVAIAVLHERVVLYCHSYLYSVVESSVYSPDSVQKSTR